MDVDYGEWRTVPGFSPLHVKVSAKGWVKTQRGRPNVDGVRSLGKPHRGSRRPGGDHRVTVEGKAVMVHRLIALAFLGPPPSAKHSVDHKDQDPGNNAVENLRWATASFQRLNQKAIKKSRCTKKRIRVTCFDGSVCDYECAKDFADEQGFTRGAVSNAINKKDGRLGSFLISHVQEDYQDLPGEVWKESYCDPTLRVSTMGRMQKKDGKGDSWGPKLLRAGNPRQGGYVVCRTKKQSYTMHRIVKITFHGHSEDPKFNQVDHINKNREDNRLANLRWADGHMQRLNQVRG